VLEFDALVSHIIYRKGTVDNVLGVSGGSVDRSFRVTSVREPLRRTWSMYMHGVSMSKEAGVFTLGARNPMEYARIIASNDQLKYAAGYKEGVKSLTPENVSRHYDHIIVSERILESFVSLGPKLGLRPSDLIFFSQKRYGFAQKITRNNTADDIVRSKTKLDARLHRLANTRLNKELRTLPTKITRILNDVPQMKKEVSKVCGMIDGEDNSCLTKVEKQKLTVWDGNQMCIARCIERWAKQNIRCK